LDGDSLWGSPVAHVSEHVEATDSVVDGKRQCRYRHSCYETGIIPQVGDAWAAPVDRASEHASEHDSVVNGKRQCRYRHSCYETGVAPPLDGHTWATPVQRANDDDRDLRHEQIVANEKRTCKYKRSCYDPDIVAPLTEERTFPSHSHGTLPPHTELEARARLVRSEPVTTHVKLLNSTCSLYRISCRLANNLPPKDAKGRSELFVNGERMCRRTGPALVAARQQAKKETRQ